jgi:hypothetical protein
MKVGAGHHQLDDGAVMAQLAQHWDKIAAILLWKLQGPNVPITITEKDFEEFARAFPGEGGPVVFTHGYKEGFALQIISQKRGAEIAALHAEKKGTKQ